MTNWTVYKVVKKDGSSKVYMTDQPVEALASFLGDDRIEIVISSTKKSYVTKVHEKELKEESLRNVREKDLYSKVRKHMRSVGKAYGPENGRKVGALSRDSGHLARLRNTKVSCPDGHVSNLQYYRVYCRNRGLDVSKCQVIE